jgi:hypothetical protein
MFPRFRLSKNFVDLLFYGGKTRKKLARERKTHYIVFRASQSWMVFDPASAEGFFLNKRSFMK